MSARNFSRAFTQDIGVAPMQYVNKRRLERARLMLEGAEHSIKMIAAKTGFNSVNRFTASFKYAFHTTPIEYRKRFQE